MQKLMLVASYFSYKPKCYLYNKIIQEKQNFIYKCTKKTRKETMPKIYDKKAKYNYKSYNKNFKYNNLTR